MSDTTATTLAVTATSPLTESMHKCSRQGCSHWFVPGSGFVSDLKKLYWDIREGDVQKSRPLARCEVLSQELCRDCKRLANFPVYSTEGTLSLMARWAAENISRKERFLEREHAYLERVRARNLALAIKREDKSPMNQLFEKFGKPKPAGHKHGRRRGRTEQRDTTVTTPEPAKGKGNTKKGGR